jgi:hypothetical protein
MAEPQWPEPGGGSAQELELLKAKLAWLSERAKEQGLRAQAEVANELELYKEFHKALVEGARSAIDRSRTAAETVQKAAAGILALYTAVLGVSFSVAENPLPSRGVLPALFLGAAVAGSTAYLAYLSKPRGVPGPTPQSSFRAAAMARTRTFLQWAGAPVSRRSYWLRASVIALGVSLMFIPAPFISGSLPYVDRLWWNEDKTESAVAAAKQDWPDVPTEATGQNLELWKIRYAAEVKEAAAAREKFKAPGQPSYANQTWWLASILGVVAVFALPFIRTS